jgi:lipopolysaccharide export system protein LptA
MIARYALAGSVALTLLSAGVSAWAQSGPPNALQGFSQNRDKPIKIDAATLEVRDKNKIATFSGNVQVVQGDTTLLSRSLDVYYDQQDASGKTLTAAQPGPGGSQKIKRLEAKGTVKVMQKDQTATGDLGIFEMATNTVTLSGNVTITQCENVLRGERLTVNLTTGVSHLEAGKANGGRVQMLLNPGAGKPGEQKVGEQKSCDDKAAAATPPGAATTGATTTPARDSNIREGNARDNTTRDGSNAPQRKSLHPSGLY